MIRCCKAHDLLIYSVQHLASQRCLAGLAYQGGCNVAVDSLQGGKRMELDELTPLGYFSEFSWHSFDEDEPADMLPNPFEDVQVLATTHDASRAAIEDDGSLRGQQDSVAD